MTAVGLSAAAASSAQASYVAIFEQFGSNVVETGGGTLDLTDLTPNTLVATNAAFVNPAAGIFDSGASGAPIQRFDGASGPSDFGPGSTTFASSSSGDGVAISSRFGQLFVPQDYVSDSPLSETSTYLSASFDSLGLTPGAYVFSWGSGAHTDTFTIDIVENPVPEPSTWAMMLIGIAGVGYAAFRRKGVLAERSA
jgi:hypothetical protein